MHLDLVLKKSKQSKLMHFIPVVTFVTFHHPQIFVMIPEIQRSSAMGDPNFHHMTRHRDPRQGLQGCAAWLLSSGGSLGRTWMAKWLNREQKRAEVLHFARSYSIIFNLFGLPLEVFQVRERISASGL